MNHLRVKSEMRTELMDHVGWVDAWSESTSKYGIEFRIETTDAHGVEIEIRVDDRHELRFATKVQTVERISTIGETYPLHLPAR